MNKYSKDWLIVLLGIQLLVFSTCRIKKQSETYNNYDSMQTQELKDKVFYSGDTIAYSKLYTMYLNNPPEDMFFWALIMANRYSYGPAYLDVFLSLHYKFNTDAGNFSLKNMDESTRRIALNYLKIAVSKKVFEASHILQMVERDNGVPLSQ